MSSNTKINKHIIRTMLLILMLTMVFALTACTTQENNTMLQATDTQPVNPSENNSFIQMDHNENKLNPDNDKDNSSVQNDVEDGVTDKTPIPPETSPSVDVNWENNDKNDDTSINTNTDIVVDTNININTNTDICVKGHVYGEWDTIVSSTCNREGLETR